jgi:hypothetical protein
LRKKRKPVLKEKTILFSSLKEKIAIARPYGFCHHQNQREIGLLVLNLFSFAAVSLIKSEKEPISKPKTLTVHNRSKKTFVPKGFKR